MKLKIKKTKKKKQYEFWKKIILSQKIFYVVKNRVLGKKKN